MPGYGTAFSRGLILGAGAALLYVAARETIAPPRSAAADDEDARDTRALADPNRLIDWDLATKVAVRASGRTPSLHPGARTQIQARYEAMLRDIEAPIAVLRRHRAVAGQHRRRSPGSRRPGFASTCARFARCCSRSRTSTRKASASHALVRRSGFQNAARMMLSSQIGVLVGYLSRRVLGQYDIALLGDAPVDGRQAVLRRAQPAPRRGHAGRAARRAAALDRAPRGDPRPRVRAVFRGCGRYLNASLEQYLKLLVDDMRGRDDGENTLLIARQPLRRQPAPGPQRASTR